MGSEAPLSYSGGDVAPPALWKVGALYIAVLICRIEFSMAVPLHLYTLHPSCRTLLAARKEGIGGLGKKKRRMGKEEWVSQ